VRARAEARRDAGGLLAWAMRPAALAASLALFIAAASLALMLGAGTQSSGTEDYATLGEALLAERDAEVVTPPAVKPPEGAAAGDSGTRL
jgi:hypothetical protein